MDKVERDFSFSRMCSRALLPSVLVFACQNNTQNDEQKDKFLNNEKLTIFYSGYFYDSIGGGANETSARVNKQTTSSMWNFSGIIVDSLAPLPRSARWRCGGRERRVCVNKFPPSIKKSQRQKREKFRTDSVSYSTHPRRAPCALQTLNQRCVCCSVQEYKNRINK